MMSRVLMQRQLLALTVFVSWPMGSAAPRQGVSLKQTGTRRLRAGAGVLTHIPILDPPVNATNELATQVAELYHKEDCQGETTSFISSGNAFLADFRPYVGNLWSVKLCGKGTFFYFAEPDMHLQSTLGHVSRCGPNIDREECTCATLEPELRFVVQSFSLQYC
eukprot:TRINITY_DN356_c0_g1_i1.p1 TRINITY_DN356_c0_g1~~TRINITY_DN356_c0_g1_i1.p1  ORF type:complete len:164 (-),score=17.64 TRINITY_DN356_c0_g1_i1:48-539(-)